ncbi:hypothetical protein AX16_003450 [Volvariella volvacea WC 439]|nr:hypothetical protein AX16_003450 [Volvariella volvacea WC 439]
MTANMGLSVDDLVSSLSASHIGQEAMDLAALHAQLAQLLFCQSAPSSTSYSTRRTQPCNTPTRRTPSSSFSCTDAQRDSILSSLRGAASEDAMRSSSAGMHHSSERDEMEEDERMVEDLLIPSSPMTPNLSPLASIPPNHHLHPNHHPPSYFAQQHQPQAHLHQAFRAFSAASSPTTAAAATTTPPPHQFHPYPTTSSSSNSSPFTLQDPSIASTSPSPSQSLFASTDPFYVQTMQQSTWTASPQSIFSQTGQVSQSSPFYAHRHHNHQSQHQPLFYTTAAR